MSAQTALTIATRGTVNGAATASVAYHPVYASIPSKTSGGVIQLESRFEERTASASLGYSSLIVTSTPANGSNLQKCKLRIAIPTLEVSSPNTSTGYQPAPKVSYSPEGEVTFFLPSRATEAEKHELHARLKSAVDQAFVLAMVKTNDQLN